jgi:AAA domain
VSTHAKLRPADIEAYVLGGPAPAKRPRLTAVPAKAIIAEPRPVEIVGGIAWAGRVGVLVAESGAGKTFVALSLAGAVSDGTPWFGRPVRQGSVAYLSFEGDALGLRLRALRDVVGCRLDHLYLVRASDPLSPRIDFDRAEHPSAGEEAAAEALDALRADLDDRALPSLGLVIVDTVRASMIGSEDSSDPVSAYLRAVRRLLTHAPGAGGLLIHHAGWQDGDNARKRERGSSAWRGNCDATLYLEVGDEMPHGGARLVLQTLKVRDGERLAPLHMLRRRVDVGEVGRDGLPVTTCVIERDPRSREDRETEEREAAEAARRVVDLQVLQSIAGRPDTATSIENIRAVAGLRRQAVADAVTRCIGHAWLVPGKRGEPYHLTDEGRTALQERAKT